MLLLVEQQCVLCGHNDALHIFGSGPFIVDMQLLYKRFGARSPGLRSRQIVFVLSVGDVRR